jgi:hypothetical protein
LRAAAEGFTIFKFLGQPKVYLLFEKRIYSLISIFWPVPKKFWENPIHCVKYSRYDAFKFRELTVGNFEVCVSFKA